MFSSFFCFQMQMKVNTYRSSQKHIYHNHCQLSNTTPGCTLLISVCIFMLPELGLAAEHVQITTMYHMNFINVSWHVTFICAPLTLPSLSNVLPAIILQNQVVWSNIRLQSCGSSHSNISPSLCLNVLSGTGRRVVEVWVVLLLLLSGDVEVNPGPVGECSMKTGKVHVFVNARIKFWVKQGWCMYYLLYRHVDMSWKVEGLNFEREPSVKNVEVIIIFIAQTIAISACYLAECKQTRGWRRAQ